MKNCYYKLKILISKNNKPSKVCVLQEPYTGVNMKLSPIIWTVKKVFYFLSIAQQILNLKSATDHIISKKTKRITIIYIGSIQKVKIS